MGHLIVRHARWYILPLDEDREFLICQPVTIPLPIGVTMLPVHIQAMLLVFVLPTIVVSLIAAIAVVIIPIVSMYLNKLILNINAKIDALPAFTKQIVVGIVTTLLTVAAQHIPGVPTSLKGLDVATIASLLNTGITFLLHLAQATPATPAKAA